MITAIVLTEAIKDRVSETAEALAALPDVTEVYSIAGAWDLVVIVRVRSNEEVADFVTHQILKNEGVTKTTTLIAFRAYSRYDLEHLFS